MQRRARGRGQVLSCPAQELGVALTEEHFVAGDAAASMRFGIGQKGGLQGIINNVISIAMWVVCTVEGDSHASLMVLMWVFYLMNSVNGCRVWLKSAREAESVE